MSYVYFCTCRYPIDDLDLLQEQRAEVSRLRALIPKLKEDVAKEEATAKAGKAAGHHVMSHDKGGDGSPDIAQSRQVGNMAGSMSQCLQLLGPHMVECYSIGCTDHVLVYVVEHMWLCCSFIILIIQ